jgi:hypothetical protein
LTSFSGIVRSFLSFQISNFAHNGDDAESESAMFSAHLQQNITARAKAAVAAGTEVNFAGATEMFTTVTDLITKDKMPITELISESYPSVMTSVFVRALAYICIIFFQLTILQWPLTPLSRGYIHINSTDVSIY